MKNKCILSLCFILFVYCIETRQQSLGPGPTEIFDDFEVLLGPDQFILFWKLNQTDLILEVHVKTKGWILLGLDQFNIVTSWLNQDQTGHFSERFLNNSTTSFNEAYPRKWFPLELKHLNKFTMLKMRRKLCGISKLENTQITFAMGHEFINNDIFVNSQYIRRAHVNLFNGYKPECLMQIKQRKEILNYYHKSSEVYMSSAALVKEMFYLYWNSTDSEFIAEVRVRTNGWFLFGFSKDGNFENSDVVFGWINDKIPYFRVSNFFRVLFFDRYKS